MWQMDYLLIQKTSQQSQLTVEAQRISIDCVIFFIFSVDESF